MHGQRYFTGNYNIRRIHMLLHPGTEKNLPDSILDSINPKTRNLFIIDDMMGDKDAVIAKLFTKKSHHGNLSVIVQNLFHQSKDHRTISLNASYIILTKNIRDASQTIHLAKQLYPSNTKFFQHLHVPMKYDFDPGSFREINIMYINLEYKSTVFLNT